MFIPALPLPSNPKIELKFRSPTVADALNYGNATIQTEEEFTTRYLNEMQEEKVLDSALWTVSDRRTALFWIWCNSRNNHGQTLSYACAHCSEHHTHQYDITELSSELSLLQVLPFIEVTVPVNGKPYEWVLKPLDGRSMEELQRMYTRLPPEGSPNYHGELQNVRFVEIVLQAHVKGQPDGFQEAGEYRYELIKGMDTYTEFAPLVANVYAMQNTLHHGLPIRIKDGSPQLYVPPHRCPVKAKEGKALETRLFFPFRPINYLPVNVPGLVADLDS